LLCWVGVLLKIRKVDYKSRYQIHNSGPPKTARSEQSY